MENYMEFKKNPELIEKPDHAHYPVCRGRLDEIEEISRKTFFYTLGTNGVLALFSLLQVPMHLVGWVPLLFTMQDTSAFNMGAGFSLFQLIMCLVIAGISLLGCTRHKIFTAIMFLLYALTFVCSLIARLTGFDFITVIIGIGGMYNSLGALKGYTDYKQLSNTEGFPIFSTVLADHEDMKKYSPNGYNKRHFDKLLREKALRERNMAPNQSGSSSPVPNLAQPQSADTKDIGGMPTLNVTRPARNTSVEQKFIPKAHKELFFSDSTLKLK
jgi:hypothetical protein